MARGAPSLLERLVEHGVPERGARIYLAACREGPQTAAELARVSALNRVEAYRFIRQLEAAGLLRATGRRPMRFAALAPAELLDRWIHGAQASLRRLEVDRDHLLEDWKESLTAPDATDVRKFAVLEGRTTIQHFLKKRLGTAESEILVSVSGFSLASAIDGGIDRALKEARGRGVRVRFVTDISAPNLAEAKHFQAFTDLKHASGPVTNRAIVVDRKGALVFVSGEEGLGATGEDQVALWSTATKFVRLARDYHQRLWRRAIRAEERVVELESPSPAVLPVVAGLEGETFQRIREIAELGMRATGIRELRLDLPDVIETVARQLGRQIAEDVEGSSPEQVAHSLAGYYSEHALGQFSIVRERPLVVRVSDCFACTKQSPEIGRVMCPGLMRSVLETRLGSRWEVTKPDPRRHAAQGCLFTITPA